MQDTPIKAREHAVVLSKFRVMFYNLEVQGHRCVDLLATTKESAEQFILKNYKVKNNKLDTTVLGVGIKIPFIV